jgi:hypothetical protein
MIRTTPVYIHCKDNHVVPDCATGGDSTSGAYFPGSVIDLRALSSRFTHIQPLIAGSLPGTTSTAGGSRIGLDLRVKHGDSSGGGDAVAYSTEQLPATRQNYFASDMSTDHPSWSTGTIRTQYSPEPIPLQGAKRYLTVEGQVTRVGISTATAAAQLWVGHLAANLINAQEEGPDNRLSVAPGGTLQSPSWWNTTATNT